MEKVLTNPHISIGGTDLSSYIKSITFSYEAETADVSAFGDDFRQFKGGLKNWNMDFEFNNDYSSSGFDDTVFSLVGTEVAVVLRPDAAAVGTDNPEFTGTGLITSYPPISGALGEVASGTLSVQAASDLSRATA